MATLSTSNRARLSYIRETAFGVTPAAGPHRAIRFTGESLDFGIKTDTSKEIRDDRMTTDLILVGAGAQGGINGELSFKEYDDLIEAALMGTWTANELKNGAVERFYSIERGFMDSNLFFLFRGMEVSKMSMDFKSGSINTINFEFMGKDANRTGATQLPGTRTASETFDVMNAVDGVGNIKENGVAMEAFVKSLKFDLDNKLRARDAIGTLGSISIGVGTLSVTGTMEVYLQDGTLYDKFINNTATSIEWTTSDGEGNGYTINFPRVKFGDAKVNAGSLDQDAMLSIPFTAIRDPGTDAEIIITRTAAV